MARTSSIVSLLLLVACSAGGEKGSEKPGNQVQGGDSGPSVASCDALRGDVEGLYGQAADAEGIAPNLRADFVRDLTHMVLADCRTNPRDLVPCIQGARSARELEAACVLALDDEGTVEGRRFGAAP